MSAPVSLQYPDRLLLVPRAAFHAAQLAQLLLVTLAVTVPVLVRRVPGIEWGRWETFAEYMAAHHAETPYDLADTPAALDERIQDLKTRSDGLAGTTDADKVIDALPGIKVPNLTGGTSEMLPNHHITKPVLIGEIQHQCEQPLQSSYIFPLVQDPSGSRIYQP